ncbi:MAG TPA: Fe-S cluster assembly protein SufD [Pseudolabrys sp.]|nr:Fe-S cluster assembly protein SufD [Pseudolabrys sp.]
MNAEVRAIRTPAEQALNAAYAAARTKLPGQGAIAGLRDAAFERFDAAGLPHRRIEEWKYTDLRALMREAKPLAEPAKARGNVPALPGLTAGRIAIVNGRYEQAWSDFKPGSGAELSDVFAFAAEQKNYRLGEIPGRDDVALSLNTAFMTGGVALRVAKGRKIDKPIEIVHVFADAAAAATYPRCVVVVEPGARLTVIESFNGPAGVDYQVNSALELVIGDGAHVDHVMVGNDGDAALRISTLGLKVGARAIYNGFTYTAGGAVVRNQIFARFDGEGTQASIGGATLLKGRQHVDNTLVINHAAGGCTSRERFRTVLDGESHGIFQGKIVVEPHAQKTDAKMASHALLLSDEAEADNKPELEIFADDVQCGHGATAGALDSALKFYLMSRGIPEGEAETLLIQAFVGEAIEEVAHEGLREALLNAAAKWLEARG